MPQSAAARVVGASDGGANHQDEPLGQRIRRLRQAAGLTQHSLAAPR
ncbi:hypothetical protein GCM10023170_021990 [Phytohabitans houttuyneae]|uniref:Uncharacterized protein n=1 Tax=Phytohabitans houttuyneae TaxID=1076126 RepID=A0A6V8JYS4_9ACTN|nr:hypothetical protein Phou_006040 [Phytohabitans houttuyneae]